MGGVGHQCARFCTCQYRSGLLKRRWLPSHIATFLRTDIDYLALEDRWICKRHAPVKAYADHEATLVDEDFPVGMGPDSPSVVGLMAELDQALFHGGTTQKWTPEELAAISRQGARFKETSRLFPEHGFLAPLRTEFGQRAVLLLDPLGNSTLADPTERQPLPQAGCLHLDAGRPKAHRERRATRCGAVVCLRVGRRPRRHRRRRIDGGRHVYAGGHHAQGLG